MQYIKEVAINDVPYQSGLCPIPENKALLIPVHSNSMYFHPCYVSIGPQKDGGWGHLKALDVSVCELNEADCLTSHEFLDRLHTVLELIQKLSGVTGDYPLQVLLPAFDRWLYLPYALNAVRTTSEELALRLFLEGNREV